MAKKRKPAKATKSTKATKARSRPDHPTRAERFEEARRRRNRRVLIGRVAIVGTVVAVVAVVLGVVIVNRTREAAWIADTETGGCAFDRETDGDAGQGRNHISSPSYRIDPPSGGNHTPQAAAPGVYSGGAVPDDGQLVHALEHGFVILWHQPDLAEDELEPVLEVRQEFERDVLVVSRPSLDVPVAATAWHQRLLCDEVEGPALATFVRNARNKGPEAVPH